MTGSLQFEAVRARYRAGVDPVDVVAGVLDRIAARGDDGVWIMVRPRDEVLGEAAGLARRWPDPDDRPPLYGLPFAVKDNIDVAGLPTTAACPDFAYAAVRSAPLVDRLRAAGAVLVGKNNLDQFATGLTGARSPYGVPASPFDPGYIAGGSSSGSAVAVAAGLVSFSIGTDTAGSGRVPAALCNVVGLKPSRGLVSTLGVVPACPSLDCPSVFALSVADAGAVLAVIAGPEPTDPWSVPYPTAPAGSGTVAGGPVPPRVGVPRELEFGGDAAAAAVFSAGLDRLSEMGATLVPVDLEPFLAAGRELYRAWVGERWAHLGDFVTAHPDSVHPVTRQVLSAATGYSAADAFRAVHTVRALHTATAGVWRTIDALMVPTVPTTYRIDTVLADPVATNAFLGYYTQFANLLDLAAVAVPNGLTPRGLPFGVSFLAPAGHDGRLVRLAGEFHARTGLPVGATGHALLQPPPAPSAAAPSVAAPSVAAPSVAAPSVAAPPRAAPADATCLLAVVGAHRTGQPLHHELVGLGAVPVRLARTLPRYRLYTLAGTGPARPGLVRVADGGAPVEVELHRIATARLGELLARIPAPLGLGRVELADSTTAIGFLAESYAVRGQHDITGYGSWPAYLDRAAAAT